MLVEPRLPLRAGSERDVVEGRAVPVEVQVGAGPRAVELERRAAVDRRAAIERDGAAVEFQRAAVVEFVAANGERANVDEARQ